MNKKVAGKHSLSIVERAFLRLNVTDNQKVANFYDKYKAFLKKQIEAHEAIRKDLEEAMEDKMEAIDFVIESPEISKIGTSENRKAYIGEFNSNVDEMFLSLREIELAIDEENEQIAFLKEKLTYIYDEA